ncbi:hypothetical protein BDV93DRAFT_547222 [Ceratobasidium sp. AG-I]|nr:hypothetical protein BDV93DRAFT_547222 [Ceratobasidium sp. AG-I]
MPPPSTPCYARTFTPASVTLAHRRRPSAVSRSLASTRSTPAVLHAADASPQTPFFCSSRLAPKDVLSATNQAWHTGPPKPECTPRKLLAPNHPAPRQHHFRALGHIVHALFTTTLWLSLLTLARLRQPSAMPCSLARALARCNRCRLLIQCDPDVRTPELTLVIIHVYLMGLKVLIGAHYRKLPFADFADDVPISGIQRHGKPFSEFLTCFKLEFLQLWKIYEL